MKNLEKIRDNVLLKDNIICDWCEKKGSGGSAVVKTRDGIVAQATLCHDCLLNDAEIKEEKMSIVEKILYCINFCQGANESSAGEILEDFTKKDFKEMQDTVRTMLED